MGRNVAEKLIEAHLVEGKMKAGEEIGLRIDQTLSQDATGTMVMLGFDAMKIPRVRAEISVQYVDHNLLQTDSKNAEDHLFLRSACRKFGVWYSGPGNGVSHPVHMERFGIPGKTLLGADSHTPAAGSLGMLAFGAGGLDVAMAMAGEPYRLTMPLIFGVRLTGELPDWCSAKDIILEMLRRHGVRGGLNRIIEYFGPGLKRLSAMDRHVIANMGAELGATTSVFPSDGAARVFLKLQGREDAWREIIADQGAEYGLYDEIDLSKIEPLIACPSSPGNVVPVAEVAGKPIYQAYIGSSANPGMRDIAIVANILDGKLVHDRVSLDINPTSRQILENLIRLKYLEKLVRAGARIHQAGCNGCIGMGQAPPTGKISLRTTPRNFPGRSGTREDQVYLCSPETAAASALTGVITDPRTLGFPYPRFKAPPKIRVNAEMVVPPSMEEGVALEKGENIKPFPEFKPIPDLFRGPVLLKTGDNISTDEIMPAGSKVLPFRSNIPEISKFTFNQIDHTFYERAMKHREEGFIVIGGENYGQGSSREHAVLAPRYLGLRAVIAKSFARIHWQNLINYGILPLSFKNPEDYADVGQEDILEISAVRSLLEKRERTVRVVNKTRGRTFETVHILTDRHIEVVLDGSLIDYVRKRRKEKEDS